MKENSPVKFARKLLLGTIMGDSGIELRGHKALLKMAHSNHQFDYLMWKAKKLVPLVGKFQADEREMEISGAKTGGYRTQLRSLCSTYLKHIYNDFYFQRDGKVKKEIHSNVLNRLSPISIAVWYGDDGNLHPDWIVRISSNGYPKSEQEMIIDFIKRTYGIELYLKQHHQHNSYWMFGNTKNSKMFIDVVKPYLWEIECLRYKLDPSFRRNSNHSARHPGKIFWDDDVLRTPWKRGEEVRNNFPPDNFIRL